MNIKIFDDKILDIIQLIIRCNISTEMFMQKKRVIYDECEVEYTKFISNSKYISISFQYQHNDINYNIV